MSDDPHLPSVALSNRQDHPLDLDDLTALARRTLRAEGSADVELSVSFVAAEEMAELHDRYLGEAGPTDVLAFPQDDASEEGRPRVLGDVVICPAVAAQQGSDVGPELRLLLVHGILHLLGYDHEEQADRAEMWARQEQYSGVAV